MNEIVKYLSAREKEYQFECDRIHEEIERTQRQIEEFRMKISQLREAKDVSYEVFSASQAQSTGDTEIATLEQLVSDKIQHINHQENNLKLVEEQLAELKVLNYHTIGVNSEMPLSEILMKLQQIYKWIPVDAHRAQTEILQLIRHLENDIGG